MNSPISSRIDMLPAAKATQSHSRSTAATIELTISAPAVRRLLLACCLLLVSAYMLTQVGKSLGYEGMLGFVRQFDLDQENNLPTYFSSINLLLAAVLLSIVALVNADSGSPDTRYWWGLAVGFLLMSVDEAASLHEMLGRMGSAVIGTHQHGLLSIAWIVPGAAVVLTIAAVYFGFLCRLPARLRWRFILAGIMFVGGAVGVEAIQGRIEELHGTSHRDYVLSVAVEETLEMWSIIFFNSTLLTYLQERCGKLCLRLG